MNEMFQFIQFVHEQDRAAVNLIQTQTCSDLLSEWHICSVDHITNDVEIAFHQNSHVLTERDFNESKNESIRIREWKKFVHELNRTNLVFCHHIIVLFLNISVFQLYHVLIIMFSCPSWISQG